MKKNNFNMRQFHKTMALWVLIILVALSLFRMVEQTKDTRGEIDYSEFRNEVRKGNVESVTIRSDDTIEGKFKSAFKDKTSFRTLGTAKDASLTDLLEQNHVAFKNQQVEKAPFWQQALLSWLPILFLVAIFFVFMRQIQVGGGKAIIPSAKKRGGPGTSLDVPLHYKDAAFVRSHFDAIEIRIPDAPGDDEMVIAVAVTDGGRPLPRIGGLKVEEIVGEDGLR